MAHLAPEAAKFARCGVLWEGGMRDGGRGMRGHRPVSWRDCAEKRKTADSIAGIGGLDGVHKRKNGGEP